MTDTTAQLDALALTETVRQRLVDFTLDNNYVRDAALAAACRAVWSGPPEEGGLVGEPWVEGAFPAETAQDFPCTLHELAQAGLFDNALCRHLDTPARVPRHRPLYVHQRQAIRLAQQHGENGAKPALVVTAGTGAGKTESFLLPLLNDLIRARETGGDDWHTGGVKCLILYPMNALVNDQVERLYGWLKGQKKNGKPPLTLFHFTGETPEDAKKAAREGTGVWDACRMRTRQEARGLETRQGGQIARTERGPQPDILITNYSMLEYMLCRPQDAVFFGPALRTVILDEAHLYAGTLAAEITLLFRRLMDRAERRPEQILHIATSATLGTGDQDELKDFAATLFTKDRIDVKVIAGERQRVLMPDAVPPTRAATAREIAQTTYLTGPTVIQAGDEQALQISPEMVTSLAAAVEGLVGADAILSAQAGCANVPAAFLCAALGASPLFHRLEETLWNEQKTGLSLRALASKLWGDEPGAERATVALLQLGAASRAQAGDYPLIPHRLHLLTRPSDGLAVCLDADCTGPPDRKMAGLGCISPGSPARCPYCAKAMLSLYRCSNCGEWGLAGEKRRGSVAFGPASPFVRSADLTFLTRHPGASGTSITMDAQTGKPNGAKQTDPTLRVFKACPHCTDEPEERDGVEDARVPGYIPFAASASLTLSILAETVLTAVPSLPAKDNIWLPARGRRLLAFSDSRREAARLGPRLTRQHETQLIRAALARCVRDTPNASPAVITMLEGSLSLLDANIAAASDADVRRLYEDEREDKRRRLAGLRAGGSLADWVKRLKEREEMGEIEDQDFAQSHQPAEWSQRAWDSNGSRVRGHALQYIGGELASPARRQVSLETLGLVEVVYPGLEEAFAAPPAALSDLPTVLARDAVRACWPDLIAALCDTLRMDTAVTLGSDEDDAEYQMGGRRIGNWCSEERVRGRGRSGLIRFVGATARQRRRKFAASVLMTGGLSPEDAEQYAEGLLRHAFRQLLDIAAQKTFPWLEAEPRQSDDGPVGAIRLRFPAFALRRPASLYRSVKTGHLWPRAVRGCAPENGCDDLEAVDLALLDQDTRYGRLRREYAASPVFSVGLWAEEHSAQLAAGENRRLQDLFKRGIRNILSSTTTLELGIDIGGLNAVLMGNVPPGKANYLQRAGRAGRRADGSSVVVTFARSRPYDREVFHQFGKYLGRELRRPCVHLDRERLARRHSHALLLGDLFRAVRAPDEHVGTMLAYGRMGEFCGIALPSRWDEHQRPAVTSPPLDAVSAPDTPWWNPGRHVAGLEARFLDYLHWAREWAGSGAGADLGLRLQKLYAGTPVLQMLEDWEGFFDRIIADFSGAIQKWREDYDNLRSAWDYLDDDAKETPRMANAIRYQMSALYNTTVIESLADRQFLPRYGFPIGLQKLRVIVPARDKNANEDSSRKSGIREEDQYRLERSGLQAIREYVPGSQLLVGGKLITSRGLLKSWSGASGSENAFGLTGQFATCVKGHDYYSISSELGMCKVCGEEPRASARHMLLPRDGYTSAAWDPPRRSNDVEGVGKVEIATVTFRDGGSVERKDAFAEVPGLTAFYREDGELLMFNQGEKGFGFAVCLKCGYADSEIAFGDGQLKLPSGFVRHAPLTATSEDAVCWSARGAQVWRNRALAARETTDVLLLDLTACIIENDKGRQIAQTLAQALQIAGAKILELDSRELGVLTAPTGPSENSWGAVVYDNVPGGAGHVQELMRVGATWLAQARNALYVSPEHDARCDIACLDCILTYDAQEAMAQGLLNRRATLTMLDGLLAGQTPPAADTDCASTFSIADVSGNSDVIGPDMPMPPPSPSIEERRNNARQRQPRQQ